MSSDVYRGTQATNKNIKKTKTFLLFLFNLRRVSFDLYFCALKEMYHIKCTFLRWIILALNEPRRERKPPFCICENKDADQLRGNREADQRLVFATRIIESLYFLNPKLQASSHLLWVHSPVCVGPGQKLRKPVFSQRCSNKWHININQYHRLQMNIKQLPSSSLQMNG